jgi:uncharacterized C2H2 Zn-finger protein
MDRAGNLKEALVTCPNCRHIFNVERVFWEPRFADVEMFCPNCRATFAKEKSPRVLR